MFLDARRLECVLCLGCHADDIEIGCGATLLRLVRENPALRVHYIVLATDAVRGGEARTAIEQLLPSTRIEIDIHGFRDSYLPYQGELVKDLFHDLASRVDPDLIFTHHREDLHQDHRLAAQLTWCAFRDHCILEYEIPKYDGDLGRPNFFTCVDRDDAARKIDVITTSFVSQVDKPWFGDDTFRSLMRLRGMECNSPSGWAEAFYARKLRW
ncbi:MAG: PIG-L deacetylase family protein [Pirellulaceae bacterium]|jgi:LmbE family N-acetylglucosaminyl deacetylase|nr:PIG-L deacetylase family protein [Pirellulaceae bacterium]MDP7014790.1 PIG-L deacetylase family protein [Pirellulaceae bacterium]